MYPVILELGPFKIYSYGFFLALAFITSSILAEREAKRRGASYHLIPNLFLICLVSGIIGARFFFIILNINFFLSAPIEIIMFWHGGLVWYGGLIFALACGLIYLKVKKQAILPILDLLAPYIALAQSIGRIGCFLNGCCFGKPWPLYNIPYPTQIISSLAMLFIFLILRSFQCLDFPKGNIFLLYLVFYSLKRFFIEFLRGDAYPVILGLSIFQIISVFIFILTFILFCSGRCLDNIKKR